MKVFTFDFVPYGKDLTGKLKYPVGRENYESEVAAKTYENHVEQFQLMEEVGFDGVCLNEHHGSPYSLDNSPNVFLAYVAAKTKRIKLAMAGNLLPLHGHPLRVAEELAMLDNLTRGRIIAGFVRGIPREYLALSIPLREGRPRFEEALDVILKAWTNDLLNHDGQFYHYKDVDMWPRPYQHPHPPDLGWRHRSRADAQRRQAAGSDLMLDFPTHGGDQETTAVVPRVLRRVWPALHGERYLDRTPRLLRGEPERGGEALQDPF